MRKTSIRELHIRTSELVREAEEGGVIVIERRGEPVAELHPVRKTPRLTPEKKAEIFKKMEKVWARMPQMPDSRQIISEDRDR